MNIIAITTAFNPDIECLLLNYSIIGPQISSLIIVNNSPEFDWPESITCDPKVHIYNFDNVGVAKGLNRGIEIAVEHNPDYLLLLDQDSICDANMIDQLICTGKKVGTQCLIAPNILDKFTKKEIHIDFFNRGKFLAKNLVQVPSTQTSGIFVTPKLFAEVGPFNENYFLNLVDSEWCWRASDKSIPLIINLDAKLFHEFGEGIKNFSFFKIKFGQPFRNYYAARDMLFFITETQFPLKVKVKMSIRWLHSLISIIFLDQKIQRLRFWVLGVRDFFKNKRGKMHV